MRKDRGAGAGVLHPMYMVATVLLVINDQWLKGRGPAVVTGKLSDVAGLVMLPLLLQAFVELCLSAWGRYSRPSNHLLILMGMVTAIGFAGVQLSPSINAWFGWGIGAIRWSLLCGIVLVSGGGCGSVRGAQSWSDVSDLWTLAALLLSVRVGWVSAQGRTAPRVSNGSDQADSRKNHE
ncbi:MAG: hypothetical protein KTR25_13010 [Myxococcales bacterium]|nr:hypothetical protein [Myxococcales bacterium]